MRAKILVVMGALVLLVGCSSGSGPVHSSPRPGDREVTDLVGARAADTCSDTAGTAAGGGPRVRLDLTPCHVSPGEDPRMVLTNTDSGGVSYSPPFKLERKTDDGWRWINRHQAFTLPLFGLGPGKRSRPETVAIYTDSPTPKVLTPGVYRVSRGVGLSGSGNTTLRVVFHVVPS